MKKKRPRPVKRYPTDLNDKKWACVVHYYHQRWMVVAREFNQRDFVYHSGRLCMAIITSPISQVADCLWLFGSLEKNGIWPQIHDTLRARVRQKMGKYKHPTAGSIDSQSVKTTALAGIKGYNTYKHIQGRKRHLLVDTLGLIMVREGAKLIFKAFTGSCKKIRRIWVDGDYRGSNFMEWVAKRFHIVVETVLRSDDVNGFQLLPRRWVVERAFAWLYVTGRQIT